MEKVHAGYRAAVDHQGRPTVVLAQTVKGFSLGEGFEGKNVTHQMKKLSEDQLRAFRDRLDLPITDGQLHDPPYFHPGAHSPEVQYIKACRAALGGRWPSRRTDTSVSLTVPKRDLYAEFYEGTKAPGGVSTTMAFARLLTKLLKDEGVGRRVVPIIPDEARTFGMEPLFRQVGIYAAQGQLYEPVDKDQLLYYRESKDGQVLEEGITEAGSMASFTAAGTAYATHGQPMIPFYIFYSMFGFQRTGDQIWAFGDARGRGFLMGATAGRTTLNGEGLQHQDGHSHLLATTVPNVIAYEPAFAYEIAMIVEDGLRRMVQDEEDVFYYVTLHNENYQQPPLPSEDVREGVLRGLYLYRPARRAPRPPRHALRQRLDPQARARRAGVPRPRLRRLRRRLERDELPAAAGAKPSSATAGTASTPRTPSLASPTLERLLGDMEGPIVAVSDQLKLVADQIVPWVDRTFVPLGTDGFGMSDTREALRRHFEIDESMVVVAALDALRKDGRLDAKRVAAAIEQLAIDPDKLDPLDV